MRRAVQIALFALLALPLPAQAQFKRYFDVGTLRIAALKEPDWGVRASRLGSTFLGAAPITIAGYRGVQMEASADLNGAIYFVTRWIGQGHRMLDVKVTARDLKLARELADTATQSLVPQVFGN